MGHNRYLGALVLLGALDACESNDARHSGEVVEASMDAAHDLSGPPVDAQATRLCRESSGADAGWAYDATLQQADAALQLDGPLLQPGDAAQPLADAAQPLADATKPPDDATKPPDDASCRIDDAMRPADAAAIQADVAAVAPAPFGAVFVIVFENTDWSDVEGSDDAPYMNTAVLPIAARAREYYNPPHGHPSEVDYIWMETGEKLVSTNDEPAINHLATTAHLTRQLQDAGVSWRTYQEDIDGQACPLVSHGLYAAKHNPFVFFDDLTANLDPQDAACIAHNRPYTELGPDLQANRVARYNFITPNLCNDGHDRCPPTNNRVRQGDDWLATALPPILASDAYRNNGVVFITWDEGDAGDGPIGMVVLSPRGKGAGYSNFIHYDHSALLRTLQVIFDVRPFLGRAAEAEDLGDLFNEFP